jgi:hypothetical protein
MSESLLEAGNRAQAKLSLKASKLWHSLILNQESVSAVPLSTSPRSAVLFCSGWKGASDMGALMLPLRGRSTTSCRSACFLRRLDFACKAPPTTACEVFGGWVDVFGRDGDDICQSTAFKMVFWGGGGGGYVKSQSRAGFVGPLRSPAAVSTSYCVMHLCQMIMQHSGRQLTACSDCSSFLAFPRHPVILVDTLET